MYRKKIIAIVGPTASGKTALGIYLAKKLNGEIISADSRQIYRGMDLIAGTVSKKEAGSIPHHMLRIVSPMRQYSAGAFSKQSVRYIVQIAKRNKIPIVVGGTGFYADALLSGKTLPEVAPNQKLRRQLEKKTAPQLFAQLQKLDPRRAKNIDPCNKVRLIRAIEIARALGKVPPLEHSNILQNVGMFEVLWLGLNPSRATLQKNIRARIRARLARGMLKEAVRLRKKMSEKRFRALGMEFQLLADCLDKKISRKDLAEKLIAWELHYAKRQIRWHIRNEKIRWIQKKNEASRLAKTFLSR